MSENSIWKRTPPKTEPAAAIPSEGLYALTISNRLSNDELASPAKSLEPETRPYRKKGYRSSRPGSYFVPSPRGVLDRIVSAARGFVRITLLMAGFILVTLFALDLLDMLKW
jgi:hypothetical protein